LRLHGYQDLKETSAAGTVRLLGDPMEVALVEMAPKAAGEFRVSRRIADNPFHSNRMRHSVLCETEHGLVLCCKGAPESVLPLCRDTLVDTRIVPLDAPTRNIITAAQKEMAEKGLRILAFAMRMAVAADDLIEQQMIFLGLVGLEDPPRPEVAEAIRKSREAGINVIMVTGDNRHTAVAIAREIGLLRSANPAVFSGDQVRSLSDGELHRALREPEVVFARLAPEQKLRIVTALKEDGHVVAVTGDGVNDAPALKAAHIGIAMGLAGTEVARAASDMVLLDDNFVSIINAVEEGRAVFQNIRKFLTYVLVHNCPSSEFLRQRAG
jgi:sodium/potassium-transporting ATPase subunit alpha